MVDERLESTEPAHLTEFSCDIKRELTERNYRRVESSLARQRGGFSLLRDSEATRSDRDGFSFGCCKRGKLETVSVLS